VNDERCISLAPSPLRRPTYFLSLVICVFLACRLSFAPRNFSALKSVLKRFLLSIVFKLKPNNLDRLKWCTKMLAWTKIFSYVIVQIKTRFCGRGLSPSVSALKRVSVVHMGVPLIPYAHFTQEEEVTVTFTSRFRNWPTLPPLGSPVALLSSGRLRFLWRLRHFTFYLTKFLCKICDCLLNGCFAGTSPVGILPKEPEHVHLVLAVFINTVRN